MKKHFQQQFSSLQSVFLSDGKNFNRTEKEKKFKSSLSLNHPIAHRHSQLNYH